MSRRGAPPRNKNATTHGFYSQDLAKPQKKDLDIFNTQVLMIDFFIQAVEYLASIRPASTDKISRCKYRIVCIGYFNALMRAQQQAPGSAGRKAAIRTFYFDGWRKHLEELEAPAPPDPSTP